MTWMENENRVDTMLQERAEALREMRAMLDSPEGQGGDLSRTQARLYAQYERRVDELDKRVQAAGRTIGTDLTNGSTLNPGLLRVSGGGVRDAGLRAIDANTDRLPAAAADRLDDLLRHGDPGGHEAEYLAAVADPDYASAFGKVLAHPQDAHLRFSPGEAEAMRRVNEVVGLKAAMNEGAPGSAGGFAVPLFLDPTIVISSSGSLNPVRQLARTVTITGAKEWRGVSSDGVTAHWYAEAAEASDDSPVLAQPVVITRRASAFIPFSIELEEDYATLAGELSRLLSDAKDQLEAQAFLDGLAANNAPVGVLASTGGLAAAQRVQTATVATFAIADNYALKAALPPRFIAGASVVASPATFDTIYRQAGGGSTEPQVMPDRGGAWLGIPAREWSNMATGTTTGTKTMILGDWQTGYIIVDRVGMRVELVPHLVGSNFRPTGQRGLFAHWRVGASVLVPNALRYCEVK